MNKLVVNINMEANINSNNNDSIIGDEQIDLEEEKNNKNAHNPDEAEPDNQITKDNINQKSTTLPAEVSPLPHDKEKKKQVVDVEQYEKENIDGK
jgi:hypothetical protein